MVVGRERPLVLGYFAASNPRIGVASCVIAGIVIVIFIVAGIQARVLDHHSERQLGGSSELAPSSKEALTEGF